MDSSIIHKIVLILLLLISPSYSIEFKGKFLQGHFILGTTDPNAEILVGKKKVKVSKENIIFKELMGLQKVKSLHPSLFIKELKKKIML